MQGSQPLLLQIKEGWAHWVHPSFFGDILFASAPRQLGSREGWVAEGIITEWDIFLEVNGKREKQEQGWGWGATVSLVILQVLGDTSAGLELRSRVKSHDVFYPTHLSQQQSASVDGRTQRWRCPPWPSTAASSPSVVPGTL